MLSVWRQPPILRVCDSSGNLRNPSGVGVATAMRCLVDDDVTAFCGREYPRLVSALTLYTGDQLLAEEFAQDALVIAVRDWDRLRGRARPGAYVHRVAMNRANSHFRRLRIRRRVEVRLRGGITESLPSVEVASMLTMRDAVASLPPRRRAVVVLRYQLDLSHAEIADVLEISVGTVKSQLHRALASLRLMLDEEEARVD